MTWSEGQQFLKQNISKTKTHFQLLVNL